MARLKFLAHCTSLGTLLGFVMGAFFDDVFLSVHSCLIEEQTIG